MVDTYRTGSTRARATAYRHRPRLRRSVAIALVGALGVATPALASDELDDIRDRLSKVEQQQDSTGSDQQATEQRVEELGEDLEHTSAELVAADERLRETTAQVEQARIVLEEAELDLADAEAEAERIETELALARADEARIEESLAANADEQAHTRSTVGAIARQSYKEGGMGSLASTLELLSGEADAVDEMSMARTVLRVQDQQIRSLADQEAEQVAEQDRLAGVRSDIDYLLAKAEANVTAKEQARAAADAAKVELEELEAQQAQAKADLEVEKAKVEESLAQQQERNEALEAELAELAETKHGLQVEEKAELQRIAEEEARRKAEEERRRKAAEKAAAEEAARQRAAEREAQRQGEIAAEAARLRDAEAAAEAQRRAEAAQAEADAAAAAAQAAAQREAADQQAAEERAARAAEQERAAAAAAASAGTLSYPVNAPTSSEFGNRFHPVYQVTRLHAGLDFAAACGTPVTAAADGVVYSAGFDTGGGNMVIIDHGVLRGVNLTTSYLHFQSPAVVSPGQSVSRGQVLGYVGTTGSSTGCHLHFETRENGVAVNPRSWL